MAQTPSGPIPGARPVETTPIRIGQGRPGVPTLQPDRLYPALVVRGGERPVLRLLGHNVQGEPRRPGLEQGTRLLVRPEMQGNRVLLHVMEHGDVLNRVSQRFGRMLYRNPWPLPQAAGQAAGRSGAAAASQTGGHPAAPDGAGAGTGVGRAGTAPPGSAPLALRPGFGGLAEAAGSGSGTGRMPATQALLLGTGGSRGTPAGTLALVGGPSQWALPRPPLQPGLALTQAPPAPGGAGGASGGGQGAPSPAVTAGAAAGDGRAPLQPGPAGGSETGPPGPRGLGQQRVSQGLVTALLNPQVEGQARLAGNRESVRHWLEALLKPGREAAGGERSERGGSLLDRLLTEKGRLLLDRWAYIPLPLSGERSGAWLQIQDRPQQDEGDDDGTGHSQVLRVWLSSDRLGGMELILPLGQGRTWRVRCESAAAMEGLTANRAHLERQCRNAGQAITLRIEGPDPTVADPPESLRRAQGLEHTVSNRA